MQSITLKPDHGLPAHGQIPLTRLAPAGESAGRELPSPEGEGKPRSLLDRLDREGAPYWPTPRVQPETWVKLIPQGGEGRISLSFGCGGKATLCYKNALQTVIKPDFDGTVAVYA